MLFFFVLRDFVYILSFASQLLLVHYGGHACCTDSRHWVAPLSKPAWTAPLPFVLGSHLHPQPGCPDSPLLLFSSVKLLRADTMLH
jgi:hypothetical protein